MTDTKPFILIVEDDAAYGKVFQRKLLHEGFDVVWAPDGEAGIQQVEKRLPNLIILDLMMPKVDGYGVLKALQEKGLDTKVKIIVATNLSQDVDVVKARSLGADDYFVKSNLSVKEMVEKVKNNLGISESE